VVAIADNLKEREGGVEMHPHEHTHSTVIAREGGRPSIPETVMIEPRSRGVLDPRLRGDDSLCRKLQSPSVPFRPIRRQKHPRRAVDDGCDLLWRR
jgi:hypothetical protein